MARRGRAATLEALEAAKDFKVDKMGPRTYARR